MRKLKQETSLFVGILVFISSEISCSVELNMKKFITSRLCEVFLCVLSAFLVVSE